MQKLGQASIVGLTEDDPFLTGMVLADMVLVAGSIDYEEFLAATVNLNHLEKEDTMYNAFRHFDSDNSGYITQQELEDALTVRFSDVSCHKCACFCHICHMLASAPLEHGAR